MKEIMEELMETDYLGMEEMSLLFNEEHNMLGIYQLPISGEALCFATYDFVKRIGGQINKNNYNLVYTEKTNQIDLNKVWGKFSFISSGTVKMRPLSVSDVIVIHTKNNQNKAYYVNYGSFKELYDFFITDRKKIYMNLERLQLKNNIIAIKTALKYYKYFIFRYDPIEKNVEYSIYSNEFRLVKGDYVKATLNKKMIYEVLDDKEIDMRKIEQVNYTELIKSINSGVSCDIRKKYNLL